MRISKTKAFLPCIAALILILATTGVITAHHSFAAFNMTEEKTVTGSVQQVEWTNPHIWIWIEVPNDKGVMETFAFEGMSPNFLERRGWTRSTLKVGDKLTVSFHPLREDKKGGMFMNGKMDSGKVLSMGGGQ